MFRCLVLVNCSLTVHTVFALITEQKQPIVSYGNNEWAAETSAESNFDCFNEFPIVLVCVDVARTEVVLQI